jgi:aldose 1-epimerase
VDVVTLRAGDLEADFAPGAGMVCASLRHRGGELLGQRKGLEAYAATGSTMGVPLLYPWANRIAERRFEVLGRTVDLDRAPARFRDDGETGLPMHGAVAAGGAWTVEDRSDSALRASFDWGADPELMAAFPFAHRVTMEVSLQDALARWRVEVEGEAPVAFGFHPYLRAGPDSTLDVPVRERLVLDEHKLPTGERAATEPITGALDGRTFDDAYAAPTAPCRLDALTLTFEEGFPYAQVFAPPGEGLVSFEPMTAPANALVTGLALPSAPHVAAFSIQVGV